MARFLRWLSQQRAWKIFGSLVLLSIVTSPLSASTGNLLLQAIAIILGFAVMFGYPAIVILGFPEPYSTMRRKRTLWIAAIVVAVVAIVTALGREETTIPEWVRAVIGIPLTLILFAPFFAATSVIGDARRALGSYKIGDCIGTWISVFSYPVIGVFFIQRQVAESLRALDMGQVALPDPVLDGRDA